jgi:PTH1 family peptidyl-tRNA hydrolase
MIVIGLGNPGPEYEQTRHNAGFLVLEAARRRWRGSAWKGRPPLEESELHVGGCAHRLVRPLTYMNRSGEAVERLLRGGAGPDDLLVVLDDIDLPLGRVRIRTSGGAGGHNGLESVLGALHPASVARLRIGVGRPPGPEGAVGHVLGAVEADECLRFSEVLERALEALQMILRRGIVLAMNRFNGLPAPWEDTPADREGARPDRGTGGEGAAGT